MSPLIRLQKIIISSLLLKLKNFFLLPNELLFFGVFSTDVKSSRHIGKCRPLPCHRRSKIRTWVFLGIHQALPMQTSSPSRHNQILELLLGILGMLVKEMYIYTLMFYKKGLVSSWYFLYIVYFYRVLSWCYVHQVHLPTSGRKQTYRSLST